MKNLLTIFLLIFVQFAFGQSGSIQGRVTDNDNNPLMFANVILQQNDTVITEIQTDSLGKYQFDNLETGIYAIQAYKINYWHKRIETIMVSEAKLILNIELPESCFKVEFITIEYKIPLIHFWNTTQCTTFSSAKLQHSPHKN